MDANSLFPSPQPIASHHWPFLAHHSIPTNAWWTYSSSVCEWLNIYGLIGIYNKYNESVFLIGPFVQPRYHQRNRVITISNTVERDREREMERKRQREPSKELANVEGSRWCRRGIELGRFRATPLNVCPSLGINKLQPEMHLAAFHTTTIHEWPWG